MLSLEKVWRTTSANRPRHTNQNPDPAFFLSEGTKRHDLGRNIDSRGDGSVGALFTAALVS